MNQRYTQSRPQRSASGGIPLGRALGAPVSISWPTVAILGLVGFQVYDSATVYGTRSASAAVTIAAVFLVGYALSVFIHELGHTIAAKAYGIDVVGIRLVAWGGMAQLATAPRRPAAAAVVAVAGPLGSLLCAVGFGSSAALFGGTVAELDQPLRFLATANVLMCFGNLLPANPLDGGRIVAALGWAASGRRWVGERVVGFTGMATAAALLVAAIMAQNGVIDVWVSPLFLAIIAFVLFSASRSALAEDGSETLSVAGRPSDPPAPAERLIEWIDAQGRVGDLLDRLEGSSVSVVGVRDGLGRMGGVIDVWAVRAAASTDPETRWRRAEEVMVPHQALGFATVGDEDGHFGRGADLVVLYSAGRPVAVART